MRWFLSASCSSSYLELRDGADSNAHVLSKLCGHSLPSSWVSSRELMYLKFHTESGSSYMGFKAKYSIGNALFSNRKTVVWENTEA